MVSYTVEKSNNGEYYVLWKNISNKRSFACMGIFKGAKKDCYKKLKEVKENGDI